MKKTITILLLFGAFLLGNFSIEAKTTKKSPKSGTTTTKTIPMEFSNCIPLASGHTYTADVPGGKITWYFNPNGRLKMSFKKQTGEGYWEQNGETFQFYGVDYNFIGYGQIEDDGKTIYIIPNDGTEEFEINIVK